MIRALYFTDKTEFRKKAHPGSFYLERRGMAGLYELLYFCPCGCGLENRLLIGERQKPGGVRPSWNWNGSKTEPTLKPSVNHVDHWHGYLRDGYWEAA
jgi:hypothetical protein